MLLYLGSTYHPCYTLCSSQFFFKESLFWFGKNSAGFYVNSRIGLKWGNGVHTTYYLSLKTTLSNGLIDALKSTWGCLEPS